MAESATTLVDLMGRRVSADPDTPYFHLYDETVTYGDLWRESGATPRDCARRAWSAATRSA